MNKNLVLRADDIDWPRYMADTEVSYKVRTPMHWEDDLNTEFQGQGEASNMHPRLPWDGVSVRLRPGEVSLWFGFNGHGKSLLLGEVMLSLCAQAERVCVASFEMRPPRTLARMARQFTDAWQPDTGRVHDFCRWAQGKLWLYDQIGSVEVERVYAVIRYCVEQLGVTQFVVDCLTKCVASDEDYVGQKATVDKLTALAQSLNIHIHLVHHARKDRDEKTAPRKMDALGASAITNLVDNVFVVWRNKAKWERPADKVDHQLPDALLICDKQRNGTGWEGSLSLGYHARSQQYLTSGSSAVGLRVYPHRVAGS